MSNEAILHVQRNIPVSGLFTCANGTGIEKGTILTLSDPCTVVANSTQASIVGGIAYVEKIANDGKTKITVLRGPGDIIKLVASGSIGIGDPLVTCSGTAGSLGNKVESGISLLGLSGSRILGNSLEAVADGETFFAELNIQNQTIQREAT